MATLKIQPHEGKLVLLNPSNGLDYWTNEDGSKLQCIFNLVGSSSKEFYKAVNGDDNCAGLTEDPMFADKLLAAMVTGWEDTGFIEEEYSPEEALDLIQDPDNLWIKKQLQDFVNDQRNFF